MYCKWKGSKSKKNIIASNGNGKVKHCCPSFHSTRMIFLSLFAIIDKRKSKMGNKIMQMNFTYVMYSLTTHTQWKILNCPVGVKLVAFGLFLGCREEQRTNEQNKL